MTTSKKVDGFSYCSDDCTVGRLDKISQRQIIMEKLYLQYVFIRSQNDLIAHNQLMFYEDHFYTLPKEKGCNGEIQFLYHFINLLK